MSNLTAEELINQLSQARKAKERARRSGNKDAASKHQDQESKLYRRLQKLDMPLSTR